jgi:DNA-binding GntR family transcriptional regulator
MNGSTKAAQQRAALVGGRDPAAIERNPMTKPSQRAQITYQSIRQAIIEQTLVPGTKLPQDEIGAHFGVSRTLVRATLAQLQTEGLVEAQPNRSARVAQPTLEEAKEIFGLRRVLEREAVRLVAERWRPEFGETLEALVREEEAARTAQNDKVSIRLAGDFHIELAALAGNSLVRRYLAELVSRCSLILATYGRPHSSECAITEHHEIIDALRRGDEVGAIEVMDKHVESVERRALLAGEPSAGPGLGTLLSRYTAATEIHHASAQPLKPKRNAIR